MLTSKLKLTKNVIIVVGITILICLTKTILYFIKIEHGKMVLLDYIAEVKACTYILDTFEYVALYAFFSILFLLYIWINLHIKRSDEIVLLMFIFMQIAIICVCIIFWFDGAFSLKFNGDMGIVNTIDMLSSLFFILVCQTLYNIFLYRLVKQYTADSDVIA